MFAEHSNTKHSQVCKNERAKRPVTKGSALSCTCVYTCIHTCVSHSPRTHPSGRKLCWPAREPQGSSCSFLLSSGRISLECWVRSGYWTQVERLESVISPVWYHFSCLKLLGTDKHNMTSEKGVQGPLLAFLSQQMRRLEEAGEGRHTLGRRQEEIQAAGRSRLCLEYQSSELLRMGTQGFWRSAKGSGKACLTKELSRDLSQWRRLAPGGQWVEQHSQSTASAEGGLSNAEVTGNASCGDFQMWWVQRLF